MHRSQPANDRGQDGHATRMESVQLACRQSYHLEDCPVSLGRETSSHATDTNCDSTTHLAGSEWFAAAKPVHATVRLSSAWCSATF